MFSVGCRHDPETTLEILWPRDEYDCLLGPLLSRLEQGQSVPEIAAYLRAEISDYFGLSPSCCDFDQVACRLYEWYRTHWHEAGRSSPLQD